MTSPLTPQPEPADDPTTGQPGGAQPSTTPTDPGWTAPAAHTQASYPAADPAVGYLPPPPYGPPYPSATGYPYAGAYGMPYGPPYPPQDQPSWRTRLAASFARPRARIGAALAAALVVGAGAGAGITAATVGNNGSDAASTSILPFGTSGTGSSGNGSSGSGSSGNGSSGTGAGGQLPQNGFPFPGSQPGTGTSSSVKASAAQSVGVVDIVTVDGYQGAEAAGTGLVLTSNGEILTNNHVIDGATSIRVTVVSSGKTYTARVVGTSPTNDIAVLSLAGASGLKTANVGDSSSVTVGSSVTGVGNAGGTGGTPSAARGTVTGVDKTITASGESGAGAERLSGLIETNAAIQSGDSGGPLYNSSNQVIGIDTAASSGSTTTTGYAIPINSALSIAKRIENGPASSTIHLGYPAFLGIALAQHATTPTISQVYRGSPAAAAGLSAGDTITAVDGTAVSTYAQLHSAIAAKSPGDRITVTYTDASGASHTATVTLTTGPAD